MRVSEEIVALSPDVPERSMYIGDANFGLKHVFPFVQGLQKGQRVLEVGSGPCLLLGDLAFSFPDIHFYGIEPAGPGFAAFKSFIAQTISKTDFRLHEGGYETFETDGKFDLVYSINVFEHLPDWKHFLEFVKRILTRRGRCVVLCSNYGFPYESHFGIPLLFSPRVTGTIFRKHIETHERIKGYVGLWSSLNFVNWLDVRRTCEIIGLDVAFNPSITRDLISRLYEDPTFEARKKIIAVPAKLFFRIGLLRLFDRPIFYRFHPYMFLEFSLPVNTSQ